MTITIASHGSAPFFASLVKDAETLIAKNEKKKGHEKIVAENRDGTSRTILSLIHVKDGFNFRDLTTKAEKEDLMVLAHQIKERGVLNPFLLFKEGDTYFVEDGHRRFQATKIAIEELGAEIKTVPFRLSDKTGNDADRVFSQFILNTGKQPTALETASIFARLITMGWSEEDVMNKSGYSKTRFKQILDMNTLPEDLKNLIRNSDIEVKPTFVHERFVKNKKDGAKTLAELQSAIDTAREAGMDRATAKHLPEGAVPGDATNRRAAQKAAETAPAGASSTPAGELPRQRLTVTEAKPGDAAPEGVLPPAPEGNTEGKAEGSEPGPTTETTPERAPQVQTTSNKEFRGNLKDFFSECLEIDWNRDPNTVPTFKAGKFLTAEQWVVIRDNLGL